MGYNLFNSNAQKFIYYSMALENSADVVDKAQYVFIQGIDESFTIAEELSTSQFEEHWNWKELFSSAGKTLEQDDSKWEDSEMVPGTWEGRYLEWWVE